MGQAAEPDGAPGLLVAGSIALDTLRGAHGIVHDELGGSALYFALAASLVRPVAMMAPVGEDGVERLRQAVAGRPIDTSWVEVVPAPTYRWSAEAVAGRNRDLGHRDSIYDRWRPQAPASFSGWAFVGSMRPDRQLEAAMALAGAELLAADAMLSYVTALPREAAALAGLARCYFCNEEELRALGGADAEAFRRRHGIDVLVVKAGPEGVSMWSERGRVELPALVVGKVVDTTGAGDSLAGAMLARWSLGEEPEVALRWGVAAASINVEAVGARALVRATPDDLTARAQLVRPQG